MSRGISCLSLSLLTLVIIVTPRLASGTLTSSATVPGFIPTAAGAAVLGPAIPGLNSVDAIASSLLLGPSIASGLGGLAATTGITSLAVLTAFEQKMNTLKALSAQVIDAKAKIAAAVKADTSNKALNWIFTPLNVIEQKALSVQGIVAGGLATVGSVLAGVVTLAEGAATGVSALLGVVATVASTIVAAPATVAATLISGGLGAVAALQTLVGLLSPLMSGNKVLQLSLAAFTGKLSGMAAFFGVLSKIATSWKGLDIALVNAVAALARALGTAAGVEVQTLVNALGPLGLPVQLLNAAKTGLTSLGLVKNVISAVAGAASG